MNTEKIITYLKEIKTNPMEELFFEIEQYEEPTSFNEKVNQFLIFLKPEAFYTEDPTNILNLLGRLLAKNQIKVNGTTLSSGPYLNKHEIIKGNYATLNAISQKGIEACTPHSIEKLKSCDFYSEEKLILGGHQLLQNYSDISPMSLCVLNDNRPITKLGSGTYATTLSIFDNEIILLNGFHPYQYDHLTKSGSAILAVACSSKMSWEKIRSNFVGSINPQFANDQSFRKQVYKQQEEIGAKQVDIAHNYIHVSPGPIEAHYQIVRFMSDYQSKKIRETTNICRSKAFLDDNDYISIIGKNPEILIDSAVTSIFDFTEDMDTSLADTFLKERKLLLKKEELYACS